jgi:hypothetical protein
MRQKPVPHIALLAALIGATTCAGQALAQLPEEDQAILEAFFIAANGENWHRNDGWLEPGSDPCEWYGVECGSPFGIDHDIVDVLELSGNGLSGTLDTRIFEIVHERLDLSDNALAGTLDHEPASPGEVDLSNNSFDGSLPAETSAKTSDSNWYLDLSGNDFEGEVPESWDGRIWLSLANNRLEGLPLAVIERSGGSFGRFLDLSDNRFSGAIPTDIMEADFAQHNGGSRWGGGINLCWNDWSLPESAEFHEWLENHHVGGDYEQCLSGERQPVDPTISGSWYHPERSGEGNAVQVLDNGMVLNYFFTFDKEGRQQWLVGVDPPAEKSVSWRELLRTRGRFGSGLLVDEADAIEVRGSFRIDRLDSDRVLAERVYIDETTLPCLAVYPPPLSCSGSSLSDRLEYQRLSQLAGTTCEIQTDFQEYSGVWYNPERSGEGFLVEVLTEARRLIVYWFTYQPDDSGQQAWMVGDGQFMDPQIIVDPPPPYEEAVSVTLFQPTGASFGPEFDPQDIELIEWGKLRIQFNDANTGKVMWNSEIEGYGSGEYPIERLAQPKLADCDQS